MTRSVAEVRQRAAQAKSTRMLHLIGKEFPDISEIPLPSALFVPQANGLAQPLQTQQKFRYRQLARLRIIIVTLFAFVEGPSAEPPFTDAATLVVDFPCPAGGYPYCSVAVPFLLLVGAD